MSSGCFVAERRLNSRDHSEHRVLSAVPSPSKPTSRLATTTELIEEIRRGHIVVLVDDEDRENEGDLIFAADFVTPEKINFLAKNGRGLICMPITAEHAAQLQLPPMTATIERCGTNFTVRSKRQRSALVSGRRSSPHVRVATRPHASV